MKLLLSIFLLLGFNLFGQNKASNEFTFNEYLGYVKKYHPLVKLADLNISEAQASLMMARGGFDPKIEIDYEQKRFKDSEYNSIPSWYFETAV